MTSAQIPALPRRQAQASLSAMFVASFLILYLELLLMRWISTEVNVFAYIQNSVLVVCFIAMGVGCLTAHLRIRLLQTVLVLLSFASVIAFPESQSILSNLGKMLTLSPNFVVWDSFIPAEAAPAWVLFLVGFTAMFLIMTVAWLAFVPLGRMLGMLFSGLEPFSAVTSNLLGSVVGIAMFFAMGVLQQPPVVWLIPVVAALVWFTYAGFASNLTAIAALLLLPVTGFASTGGALEVAWSPYQKLAIFPSDYFAKLGFPESDFYRNLVLVNNAGYQVIIDRESEQKPTQDSLNSKTVQRHSRYDIPTLLHPDPQSVLVVGAGTGNDVAGALRNGAGRVTAVEIDSVIVDFGKRYHPELPYQSDRVTVVVDDARAFFSTTSERYDVVVFGVLDSHTHGAFTNVRLDHYVYTQESLALAKNLLKPGGIMVLTFNVRLPFIADRINAVFISLFGSAPEVFQIPYSGLGWGGTMFAHGDREAIEAQIARVPFLSEEIGAWKAETPISFNPVAEITTDDWPYLYLPHRTIPPLYYLFSLLLLVPFFVLRGVFGTNELTPSQANPLRWSRSDWWFFLFGFAFLLLQIHNISKVSPLVGSTWQVSGIIIISMLLVSLSANLVAGALARSEAKRGRPVWFSDRLLFAALVGCCLLIYVASFAFLSDLPRLAQAPIAALICATPIFFSSLLYYRMFAKTPNRPRMLAVNLFGSLIAGIVQSITFITGIGFLALLTAAAYALAGMLRLEKSMKSGLPEVGEPEQAKLPRRLQRG